MYVYTHIYTHIHKDIHMRSCIICVQPALKQMVHAWEAHAVVVSLHTYISFEHGVICK
jgi:hypothetical protein